MDLMVFELLSFYSYYSYLTSKPLVACIPPVINLMHILTNTRCYYQIYSMQNARYIFLKRERESEWERERENSQIAHRHYAEYVTRTVPSEKWDGLVGFWQSKNTGYFYDCHNNFLFSIGSLFSFRQPGIKIVSRNSQWTVWSRQLILCCVLTWQNFSNRSLHVLLKFHTMLYLPGDRIYIWCHFFLPGTVAESE